MRTKKQIRKGKVVRVIWSYVLFALSIIMVTLAYLTLEYSDKICEMGLLGLSTMDKQSEGLIMFMCALFVFVAIMLFISGLFVILNRKVRHHSYVERPHSSRV